MYIYIFIHTNIHIYICICIYIYIYIYTYLYTYIYTYIYIHTDSYIYLFMYIYILILKYMYIQHMYIIEMCVHIHNINTPMQECSTHEHATQIAWLQCDSHITSTTNLIRLACSVRVRLQQRCHHLWPRFGHCCNMQRQLARLLRKRRQSASSARLTAGRQALCCSQLSQWCCSCVPFQ